MHDRAQCAALGDGSWWIYWCARLRVCRVVGVGMVGMGVRQGRHGCAEAFMGELASRSF